MTAEFRLDGKLAVITGGASGIGRSIAEVSAASGATVHILDIDGAAAASAAAAITATGGNARSTQCDVSSQQSVRAAFQEIVQQGDLHIFVNNAGIAHIGNLENTSDEDFNRIFQVNVRSYFLLFASRARTHEKIWRRHSEYRFHRRHRGSCRPLCVVHEQRRRARHDFFHRARLSLERHSLHLHLSRAGAHAFRGQLHREKLSGARSGNVFGALQISADWPHGATRGSRQAGFGPLLGCRFLCHRRRLSARRRLF